VPPAPVGGCSTDRNICFKENIKDFLPEISM